MSTRKNAFLHFKKKATLIKKLINLWQLIEFPLKSFLLLFQKKCTHRFRESSSIEIAVGGSDVQIGE